MPSPIVYFQIGATDAAAMADFCREVFGWDVGQPDGAVTDLDTGARAVDPNDIYVTGSIRQLAADAAPFVSLHVRVADLDATIERAVSRGAALLVPRRDPAGGASIAVIQAPTGHRFALVQL